MSVLRAHAFRASYTVTEWMEQWYKCLLFTYIRLLLLLFLLCCSCRRHIKWLCLFSLPTIFSLLYLYRKIKGRHELDDNNKCFSYSIDACVSSHIQHPIPRHTRRFLFFTISLERWGIPSEIWNLSRYLFNDICIFTIFMRLTTNFKIVMQIIFANIKWDISTFQISRICLKGA